MSNAIKESPDYPWNKLHFTDDDENGDDKWAKIYHLREEEKMQWMSGKSGCTEVAAAEIESECLVEHSRIK